MPSSHSAFVLGAVLALGFVDAQYRHDENLYIVSYANADYPVVGLISFVITYSVVSLAVTVAKYALGMCFERTRARAESHAEEEHDQPFVAQRRHRKNQKQDSFVEFARAALSEVEALHRQYNHFYFDTSRSRDRWMKYIQESFDHGYPFNPHQVVRDMYG
jgi:hypothetical protein